MQVRNLSGEMTLSPVSCSSCLLSHFISWLLLLSPVSYSCLQSHLLSPSPVSCLLSPVFPLLFYVFCRLFHSPVSHLIFHQSWADASASFAPASHLSCLHRFFRDRVTSFASFAHPNAFCWRNGGRHNSHSSVFRVILSGADISQPITVYIYNPVIF